jgi:hypothetical protein
VNSWTAAPFPTANRSFDFQSALLKLIDKSFIRRFRAGITTHEILTCLMLV